jgi:hypothetical protein
LMCSRAMQSTDFGPNTSSLGFFVFLKDIWSYIGAFQHVPFDRFRLNFFPFGCRLVRFKVGQK